MKWHFQLLPWALYTQFPKTARARFLKCKSTPYYIRVRILQNCSAKLCLTPGSLPGLIPYPSSYPLLCDSYTGPAEIQIKQNSLLPQTIFFFLSGMLSPWFALLFHVGLCKKPVLDYSTRRKKKPSTPESVSISCLCLIYLYSSCYYLKSHYRPI